MPAVNGNPGLKLDSADEPRAKAKVKP